MIDMKLFIGRATVVKAVPMLRGDYVKYRSLDLPSNEDPEDQGFLVKYSNGHETWSPALVFSDKFMPCTGMPFGHAIEAMKAGKKVARVGWNGKGMWLRVVYPYTDKQFLVIEGEFCEGTLLPYIGMKTADNGFVPWLASQTDMLSEDWMIVE